MTDFTQWAGFEGVLWKREVNVRDFIQRNYTPYVGDEAFLEGPTEATNILWGELKKLQKEELVKPFVLLDSVLYRCAIYRTEKSAYLFLDTEHIIFDGGSYGLLMKDFISFYSSFSFKNINTYFIL